AVGPWLERRRTVADVARDGAGAPARTGDQIAGIKGVFDAVAARVSQRHACFARILPEGVEEAGVRAGAVLADHLGLDMGGGPHRPEREARCAPGRPCLPGELHSRSSFAARWARGRGSKSDGDWCQGGEPEAGAVALVTLAQKLHASGNSRRARPFLSYQTM